MSLTRRSDSMGKPRHAECSGRDAFTTLGGVASRRGFSLLEMLVATALLGAVIIGLLTLVTSSLSNAMVVQEYDRAAMLGKAKMNELLVVSHLAIGQPMNGRYDEDWHWEAVVTPFEVIPPVRVGGLMILRIQLLVSWRNAAGNRRREFVGYRTVPIRPEDQDLVSRFR